jgi:hypothetical protein
MQIFLGGRGERKYSDSPEEPPDLNTDLGFALLNVFHSPPELRITNLSILCIEIAMKSDHLRLPASVTRNYYSR